MRSHPKLQPSPLIKFEDMSLVMFSQLKLIKPKSGLISRDDEVNLSQSPQQQPLMSSPTIYG
jgi:hypothetical protein